MRAHSGRVRPRRRDVGRIRANAIGWQGGGCARQCVVPPQTAVCRDICLRCPDTPQMRPAGIEPAACGLKARPACQGRARRCGACDATACGRMPFAMQFGPVARDLVAANGQAGERARRPTRSPPHGCGVPAVIGWSVGEPTEGPAQRPPVLATPRRGRALVGPQCSGLTPEGLSRREGSTR